MPGICYNNLVLQGIRANNQGFARGSFVVRWPRWIGWILLLAFTLRMAALTTYGLDLTLRSDDEGYVNSAIRLLETGTLTYRGPTEPERFAWEPTVKIMPGQPLLLAIIFLVFGTGIGGLYAAKIVMILIGLAGIYGVYALGKYSFGTAAGLIGALLLAVSIQHILTDNLLLTETPFMTCLIYLVYYSVRLASERKWSHFGAVLFFYIAALLLKATIALYPAVLLVYLLLKRYPLSLMARQAAVAGAVVLLVLGPWWVRNYVHYERFIPLTAGEGNPLLLGTYQGVGYPNAEPLEDLLKRLHAEHAHADAFTLLEAQKEAAKERIRQWWQSDPQSFLYSYLVHKPVLLWKDTFYWIEIFGVPKETVRQVQPYVVWAGLCGWLLFLLLGKRSKLETAFVAMVLLYFTAVYSVYFVFGRYNTPEMPFLFLGIGAGLTAIWTRVSEFKRV